jgi:hypothetical protein
MCGATLIERVLGKADSVVVGEISHSTFLNADYSFTLVVRRSLKGDLKPGVAVPVHYNAIAGTIKGNGEFSGQFGLWFLAAGSDGEWSVLSPRERPSPLQFAYYPLSKRVEAQPWDPKETSVVDRVFLELASSIDLTEPGQTFQFLADGALRCVGTPASSGLTDVLLRWSRSASANLTTLGLTGLVMLEDTAALVRSAGLLAVIKESQIADRFRSAVSASRSPNPEGVRALGDMATADSGIPKLAADAAYALRSIHTKESLPYLAKLLDSQDAELRAQAVAGFTLFARNLPIETPAAVVGMAVSRPVADAPYKTPDTDRYSNWGRFERTEDEQAAVGFWKSWWASHRAVLEQSQP